MKKTNAARILDTHKVVYQIKEYKVDPDNLRADNVAAKIGMPLDQVFKTLVARGDKTGVVMACLPGSGELDLKALAQASGNKRVEMVQLKEVQGLTGYIRGGVSPLGVKKPYPIYFDTSITKWDVIAVSAGIRGAQLIVAPSELVRAANGTVAAISRPMAE